MALGYASILFLKPQRYDDLHYDGSTGHWLSSDGKPALCHHVPESGPVQDGAVYMAFLIYRSYCPNWCILGVGKIIGQMEDKSITFVVCALTLAVFRRQLDVGQRRADGTEAQILRGRRALSPCSNLNFVFLLLNVKRRNPALTKKPYFHPK